MNWRDRLDAIAWWIMEVSVYLLFLFILGLVIAAIVCWVKL